MITVETNITDEYYVSTHVFQWDKGETLQISGLNLNTPPVVHFANKKSEKALVIEGLFSGDNISNPVLTVNIPNSLLQEPYNIIAYLYTYSNTLGKTIKVIEIPVKPRTKPDDYIFTGDDGYITLAEINAKVDSMKNELKAYIDGIAEGTKLGNADTLDGKHASEFALVDDKHYLGTYSSTGAKYVDKHRIVAKHNVKNDGRFYLQDEDTHQVRVNYADGADTATTAKNVNGVTFLVGTATPQTADPNAEGYVPEGAWYGRYEAETT